MKACFDGSDMRKVFIRDSFGMDLSFRNCDLTGANFQNAMLTGADFSGANLTGVKFAGACFNSQTKWPTNCDPAKHEMILDPIWISVSQVFSMDWF